MMTPSHTGSCLHRGKKQTEALKQLLWEMLEEAPTPHQMHRSIYILFFFPQLTAHKDISSKFESLVGLGIPSSSISSAGHRTS